MLSLSRRQTTVLFLLIVSFIFALIASMIVIHATNPDMWNHLGNVVPDIMTHF